MSIHSSVKCSIFTDQDGKLLKAVSLRGSGFTGKRQFLIVDVDRDGFCEFLENSDSIRLFDHEGKQLWSYGSRGTTDNVAAGDVNGDGAPEFAFGIWMDGLHVIDKAGRRVMYVVPSTFGAGCVAIADVDGKGRPVVLAEVSADLVWYSPEGKELYRRKIGHVWFVHTRWPGPDGRDVLILSPGQVVTLDCKQELAKLPVGLPMMESQAKWVRFRADAPPYLVIGGSSGTQKGAPVGFSKVWGVLTVLDSSGNIVYREWLNESGAALGVIPSDVAGEEVLLVGTVGKVLAYRVGSR